MIFKNNENVLGYLNVKNIKGNLKKQVDIVKDNLDLYKGVGNITLRSYLIYYIMVIAQISLAIFSFYGMIISSNIILYIITLVFSIWYLFISIILIKTDFKYVYLEREIYLKRKDN